MGGGWVVAAEQRATRASRALVGILFLGAGKQEVCRLIYRLIMSSAALWPIMTVIFQRSENKRPLRAMNQEITAT